MIWAVQGLLEASWRHLGNWCQNHVKTQFRPFPSGNYYGFGFVPSLVFVFLSVTTFMLILGIALGKPPALTWKIVMSFWCHGCFSIFWWCYKTAKHAKHLKLNACSFCDEPPFSSCSHSFGVYVVLHWRPHFWALVRVRVHFHRLSRFGIQRSVLKLRLEKCWLPSSNLGGASGMGGFADSARFTQRPTPTGQTN